VDSVTVPAGGYLAFARVSPTSNSGAQSVHCELIVPDGAQVDSDSVSLAAHTSAPIVLEGAINISSGGKITVQCSESAGTGVTVEGPHLAAIKLGSVS
jgi:hypothetical protein